MNMETGQESDMPMLDNFYAQLRSQDPAATLKIDTAKIRAQIESAISPDANVVPLSRRRRWIGPAFAAMSVAAVSVTGIMVSYQGLTVPSPGQNVAKPATTTTTTTQPALASPESAKRLEEIGQVKFLPGTEFPTTESSAPVLQVTGSRQVSKDHVEQTAHTLGLQGKVTATPVGYKVEDSRGSVLVVTTGELASLKFTNQNALKMECVPVGGNNNGQTPPVNNPGPTPNQSGANGPDTLVPVAPITQTPLPSGEPDIEAPSQEPSKEPELTKPSELPAPVRPDTQIPEESAPAGKPQEESGTVVDSGTMLSKKLLPGASGRSNLKTLATTVDLAPQNQKCVWQVVGTAPSTKAALNEIAKVASALGGSLQLEGAQASQEGGVTKVSVPVKLADSQSPTLWHAKVTQSGVAFIDASLAKTQTVGTSEVISQAQAVARLNDPKYGPLDVWDPAGVTKTSDTSSVKLVSAQLATAPVKNKAGKIEQIPVYQITDTLGRIWTVSAQR